MLRDRTLELRDRIKKVGTIASLKHAFFSEKKKEKKFDVLKSQKISSFFFYFENRKSKGIIRLRIKVTEKKDIRRKKGYSC